MASSRWLPRLPHWARHKAIGNSDPHDAWVCVGQFESEPTVVVGGRKCVDVECNHGARNPAFADRANPVGVRIVKNDAVNRDGKGGGEGEQEPTITRLSAVPYPLNRFSGSTPVSTISPVEVIRTSATGVASIWASV